MAGAFCAEPLANIDSALQTLALHAKQSMPEANVAGGARPKCDHQQYRQNSNSRQV
jgi:hypothetical protein